MIAPWQLNKIFKIVTYVDALRYNLSIVFWPLLQKKVENSKSQLLGWKVFLKKWEIGLILIKKEALWKKSINKKSIEYLGIKWTGWLFEMQSREGMSSSLILKLRLQE